MTDKQEQEHIGPAKNQLQDAPANLADTQPVGGVSSSTPQAKPETAVPSSSANVNASGDKEKANNGKGGSLQVEEQEHHEHKDQISPELEALLHTDPMQGLTDQEVEDRRVQFGPNELKEVKKNPIIKFLGYFTGAIAYLIEIACIISAVVKVSMPLSAPLPVLSVTWVLSKKKEKRKKKKSN
ncbi:hypothetical protein BC939DRAFT_251133 [Gamsiella multidivaricata]|uniref:uncharacterized protein n=1 Tax=Gamsiella multidivaricata TaxID=101098 RepID=UPI0022200FC3|nr:uncharacterized protein BC939DRAFT_251133 [Gamsiella multidivaricata]KAI7819707.1 hypothetical protein BC939DRAFT_251133 [Gamsiella multidivaricata]